MIVYTFHTFKIEEQANDDTDWVWADLCLRYLGRMMVDGLGIA